MRGCGMAFTTLALAVMSTAAPLVLRQHVSATPAHRLSIPEVYNKLVQKKDGAVEFATEFKKQVKSRVFEYRSGLADVRAAITGDYARRRRLSVLDTYFSDLGTIIEAFENGETTGMKDLHSRFMGISCTNGEPNANLMNAMESELTDLSEASSLNFLPTITKTFRCLCGSSWDLGGSEHRELHDALKALLDGNDGRSYWTRLIVAGKNTLPSYLGSSGLCSDPCKEMFVTMIELGFSAAEAPDLGAAAILPVAPKAAFPTSYISCMCGMSYDTMLPTLFPDGRPPAPRASPSPSPSPSLALAPALVLAPALTLALALTRHAAPVVREHAARAGEVPRRDVRVPRPNGAGARRKPPDPWPLPKRRPVANARYAQPDRYHG